MITRLLPALVQTHLEKKKKNNNVIYEHYVLGTRCSPSIFFQSAFKPSASKTIISSGNVPAEEWKEDNQSWSSGSPEALK